ncbi:MAG: MFS transporter [Nitrospirae bacterium]|nr:MFS transporter [Nitrospirota bacterium]
MELLRNRAFLLATMSNFFFHLNFTAFFLLPLYVRSLGGSEAEIGLIMGSFGLTSMFLIPWVGTLLDRYGRRRFLILGSVLMSVGSLGYGLIQGYHPILFGVLRALQGASFSCTFIAASTYVVDLAPADQRARAIGHFGVFTLVTHALGPMLCEGIVHQIGYRGAFLATTGWTLLAVLLARPLDETLTPTDPRAEVNPSGIRPLLAPLATTLLTGGSFVAVVIFMPLLMEELGMKPVSLFFAAYTAAAIAVRLGLAGMSDRLGRRPTVFVFLTVFCLSIFGMVFLPPAMEGRWAILTTCALLFGASHGMLYPTLSAYVVDLMPDAQKGRAIGYYSGAFNVGATLAAFAFGPLLEARGFSVLFATAGVCSTVALLLFWALRPARSGA